MGPAPLAMDATHAKRIADLQLYIRQHHAEKDDALARHRAGGGGCSALVTFDSAVAGTTDAEWSTMEGLGALPAFDLSTIARLTVVAAHPDDETLGAGGLIAECSMRGIPIQIVVVTDGAASHPESSTVTPRQLAARRGRELFHAVSVLAPSAEVVMLGFADGETLPIGSESLPLLREPSNRAAQWRPPGVAMATVITGWWRDLRRTGGRQRRAPARVSDLDVALGAARR